jgi:hypothetical protein
MFKDPTTKIMADFLNEIGITVIPGKFKEETFLPGILIDNGKLIIDEEKLLYPGDLLHDAGHLAVKQTSERKTTHINCGSDPAEEMMALAWSYAALVHLKIQPEIVFHEHGYKGQSQQLIEGFQQEHCIGLPMLQWVGMTADVKNAPALGVDPFPHMIKWLRD